MRLYPLITLFWLLPCSLFCQTNISGVVNTYHKVTGINYTNSGIRLDHVSGIAVSDRVMIIQMKGAAVNTTTTSGSFGSVSSMNDAGNYELATVCAVRGDSVFLLQQLLRTYTVEDKVQLIKIAKYASANVTGALEAAVWDSASGKGGVLAVIVSGTLTLNAPLTASAKGFKGGSFYKDAGGCATNAFQNYAYDPRPSTYVFYSNVQRGGYKGESVSDLIITLSGGKGASSNGGGGGNNHNNGGGGGSNLAAAGKGGDNLSTTGCAGQHAGIGGYALNSNAGEKIFFGGGGGAGHANNTISSSGGGNGGGIIFIQAQTLVSNGYTISANGAAGGNTYGDGASGGGGGGTIIMSVADYTDLVAVEANGGNGGLVDDEVISGRCYGEGGGGSGGVIYFSGIQPAGTINVAGGVKGAKINSTCASSTGMDGTAGSLVANYEYRESIMVSSCGAVFLDAGWRFFRLSTTANNVTLQWAVTSYSPSYFLVERRKEGFWHLLTRIPAIENKTEYSFRDIPVANGKYQYRIKQVKNLSTSYSMIKEVNIKNREQTIGYDPSSQQLFIHGGMDKNDTFSIFDLTGKCIYRKIFSSKAETWLLPASFLKNGIYIARTERAVVKFLVSE